MRIQIATALLASLVSANVWSAEQKVLFCASKIAFNKWLSSDQCRAICSPYSPPNCLREQLDLGWEVTSSSPKEVIAHDNGFAKCSCTGTEYVLKQPEPPAPVTAPPISSDEIALLRKEIELLKRENELQRQEIIFLKERSKDKKK